jgi:regulator of protease activity HflC (stomatin/prohibitin superfamily)
MEQLTFLADGQVVVVGLLILTAVLFIFLGVHKIPDGNARIVERLGKRHKVMMPGINITIPFLDNVKKTGIDLFSVVEGETVRLYSMKGDISLAEHRMDPEPMPLIASDNSKVYVDSVAYFKIIEPMKAVYDVSSFSQTFMSMIETTLRQEVAKFDGDTIISARDSLSESLRQVLQEAAVNWGITIFRVEIENISFGAQVEAQLSAAREQELIRRAEIVSAQSAADQSILEAEAVKKAAILQAEGQKQSVLLIAQADKEAQILAAQAAFEEGKLQAEAKFLLASREQEGIAKGYEAIINSLSSNPEVIVALESIKAQEKVAESIGKSANTLILPTEAAGLFGAFGAAAKGISMLNPSNKG